MLRRIHFRLFFAGLQFAVPWDFCKVYASRQSLSYMIPPSDSLTAFRFRRFYRPALHVVVSTPTGKLLNQPPVHQDPDKNGRQCREGSGSELVTQGNGGIRNAGVLHDLVRLIAKIKGQHFKRLPYNTPDLHGRNRHVTDQENEDFSQPADIRSP